VGGPDAAEPAPAPGEIARVFFKKGRALKTWMLGAIIGLSVPAEVKRAAAYAALE
jgi:hypothetical protein